jgi:hypothetical protein
MTKLYELIPGNIYAENLRGFALHLCLQMCVNMADLTQLSGFGGGYVL